MLSDTADLCRYFHNLNIDKMESKVLEKLEEIKAITLLGVKQALSMNDATLLTGLSKSHIYKLVCSKKVPYYKAHEGGKFTFFDKDELTAWMLGRRVKTDDEIADEATNYVVMAGYVPQFHILTRRQR